MKGLGMYGQIRMAWVGRWASQRWLTPATCNVPPRFLLWYLDPMSDAKALLAAAWATGELTPLLVLADMLDEQNHPDFAELLRLTIAEGQTARHNLTRHQRLQQLRTDAVDRLHHLAWPDMAILPGAAMSFSRRTESAHPDREHIVVRADRHTIHWFRSELDGQDEVIRTRHGDELLRCRLTPERKLIVLRRSRRYSAAAFTVVDDFFPISDNPADRKGAEAEQLRLFEAALAPAQMAVEDLPTQLVPFIAWLLAQHAADRTRRVKVGEMVPGTHLFIFRNGAWRYEESPHNKDYGRADELLSQRLRREARQGGLVGLLIRLDDNGRITARKLIWIGADGRTRGTATLKGAASTLPVSAFQQVVDELGLQESSFVLDSPEKLRALFGGR